MTSFKNIRSFSKILFLKDFQLLSMRARFKSINSSSLSGKKYGGGNLTPTSQNKSVGIWLIEFTEPCDALNYNAFFKHCVLQTILHVFLLLIFVWNKIFCSKN